MSKVLNRGELIIKEYQFIPYYVCYHGLFLVPVINVPAERKVLSIKKATVEILSSIDVLTNVKIFEGSTIKISIME